LTQMTHELIQGRWVWAAASFLKGAPFDHGFLCRAIQRKQVTT
jgi:hypothetical protein